MLKALLNAVKAHNKDKAINHLNEALRLEKQIIELLLPFEKAAQNYATITKDEEITRKICGSLRAFGKYKIEEWLARSGKYLAENNLTLVMRTIDEELLDSNFGMISGRLEHTRQIEQVLPIEECNEALAYNKSLEKLNEVFGYVKGRNAGAQFKEEFNSSQLISAFQEATKNLLGRGWLWKKGIVPDIEKHYRISLSADLSELQIQTRIGTLKKLEDTLKAISQNAFTLLEANLSLNEEQIDFAKKNLTEALLLFNTRAVNLIIPSHQRGALAETISGLEGYYQQLNKRCAPSKVGVSSDIPEFVYEFFQTMEDLAKGAKQKAEESDFKEAVLQLEEIYRITLRRDWERVKKVKEGKLGNLLAVRNSEIKEVVEVLRNKVRVPEEREKYFNELLQNLEQTNQLLAVKRE